MENLFRGKILQTEHWKVSPLQKGPGGGEHKKRDLWLVLVLGSGEGTPWRDNAMLEAGPETRGMMGTRAANDPSVFTIMEKAPTRASLVSS